VSTEIVVSGAGNAHQALRLSHQVVKSLTENDGNDRGMPRQRCVVITVSLINPRFGKFARMVSAT